MDDGAVIPSSDGDRRAVGLSGAGGAEPGGAVLTTARLRLSPVAAHELEELFALHADPRAFAEDATAPLAEKEQMRWVLTQWRTSWDLYGVGYLSLRARRGDGPTGLPAGLLGVVGLTPLGEVLSAYWRLAPAVQGRGLASEAMAAVLAHPVLGGGGAEVLAVTAARNAPSRALAQRLGFRPAPPGRPVPGGRDGDVLLVRPGTRRTGPEPG